MQTDVARQSLSFSLLLFAVLGGLFWLRGVAAPYEVEAALPGDVLLGGMVTRMAAGSPWLAWAAGGLLAVVTALHITRISTRNMLYVNRSFLPITFFVTAACGVFVTPGNVNGLIAVFLFTGSSAHLAASFRRAPSFDLMFRAGIGLGLMPLFYPPALVLWTGVPVAMLLYRRLWREGVACLVGLLMPLAAYSYIDWLAGGEFTDAPRQVMDYLGFGQPYAPLGIGIGQTVVLCLMTLVFFLSTGTYLGMARSMRTRPARIIAYFLCMTAVALTVYALPCRNAMMYPLLAAGFSMVAPVYFVRNKGLVPALLFAGLAMAAVAVNLSALTMF